MKKLKPVIKKLDRSIEFHETNNHRHINCERYDKCLSRACKKNWESFSCMSCPIFKEYKKIRKKIKIKFGGSYFSKEEIEWKKSTLQTIDIGI